jgi:hypothetical protein
LALALTLRGGLLQVGAFTAERHSQTCLHFTANACTACRCRRWLQVAAAVGAGAFFKYQRVSHCVMKATCCCRCWLQVAAAVGAAAVFPTNNACTALSWQAMPTVLVAGMFTINSHPLLHYICCCCRRWLQVAAAIGAGAVFFGGVLQVDAFTAERHS